MSSNKLIQEPQVETLDRQRIKSLRKNQPSVDDKTAEQKTTGIDFSKTLAIVTAICLLIIVSIVIIGSYIFSSIKLDTITSHVNMEQNKPSTYERLGHSECPDTEGTSSIYTGFIVGFSTTGPTTFRCLPTEKGSVKYYNDTFSKYTGSEPEVHYLNLTEYQTFRPGKTNFDATCALCSVSVRNFIQMIPATYECPEGWTREYYGYLMTGFFSTTFVCVDIEMEGFQNSADAAPNHPTLHHVTAHYKISHSDEYLDGKVLSCAVCSK